MAKKLKPLRAAQLKRSRGDRRTVALLRKLRPAKKR
jgi:hypothetical protein